MKIYEKYLFLKILGPVLVITLGITGVAWLSQSLRFIDFIVNKGLSVTTFVYLTSLILPSLLWVIVPVSLFISIVFAFHRLSSDSELIIYKTSGLSSESILKPVLKFAFLTCIFSYIVGLYLMPSSFRQFKDLQNHIRHNYATVLLQEGVFSSPTTGLTVYIEEKLSNTSFKGLLVHDEREKDKRVTLTAKEGTLIKTDEGPVFVLSDGSHQEKTLKNDSINFLYFDRYNLKLSPLKKEYNTNRRREVKERYMSELIFVDKNEDQKFINKAWGELHYRITWPLYNIILAVLALYPFLKGEFSRRGNSKSIILVSVISLLVVLANFAVKNLITKNVYYSYLLYVNLTILGIILYVMIRKSRRFGKRKRSKLKAKHATS